MQASEVVWLACMWLVSPRDTCQWQCACHTRSINVLGTSLIMVPHIGHTKNTNVSKDPYIHLPNTIITNPTSRKLPSNHSLIPDCISCSICFSKYQGNTPKLKNPRPLHPKPSNPKTHKPINPKPGTAIQNHALRLRSMVHRRDPMAQRKVPLQEIPQTQTRLRVIVPRILL